MRKYSKGWETYMGSSKSLSNDILLYGLENFKREILEECNSKEELQEREIFHLNENKVLENDQFYNTSIPHKDFRIKGNTNSSKGKTWEEIYGIEGAKIRRENSKLKGKRWEDIYGVEESERKRKKAKEKRSKDTKLKMSNARKGIKYSEETKRKISEGVKSFFKNKKTQDIIIKN